MKLLMLYRPNSESARSIEEFVRELQTRHNLGTHQLEVVDYDSRDGMATASLYDVLRQPAIVVTNDDGSYVKHWEGNQLPLVAEVAGYVFDYQ